MSEVPATDFTQSLLERRSAFKAFLVARVGNDADAEDLLQNGLVKALAHANELKNEEKAVAWFYRLLRNVVIDHIRSQGAGFKRDTRWAEESILTRDDEAHRLICACFERLLPTLKPTHAELIRRVELQEQSVAAAAKALKMTPNNASVILHRARAELRRRLTDFCGDCACLDRCECD